MIFFVTQLCGQNAIVKRKQGDKITESHNTSKKRKNMQKPLKWLIESKFYSVSWIIWYISREELILWVVNIKVIVPK